MLWDTLRPNGLLPEVRLSLRHFIMAVKRVVRPEQLCIATPEQQLAFLGRGHKRKACCA